MNWREVSEINFGRIVKGEITPTRFDKTMFFPPYDRGFEIFLSGGDKGSIAKEIGLDHFQSALYAAQELNGAGEEVDWAELLESSALRYKAADDLERVVKKLRDNKEPDWTSVQNISSNAQAGLQGKFFTLEEVWDKKKERHWQKSGVKFLDYWIGGIPKVGLTVVGGRPKCGKTSFAMGLVMGYVKAHPDKNVLVYTIEMMIGEFKDRLREFEISGELTKEQRERIILCEEQVDPTKSINWASTIPNLGLMIVDFADLMVSGEVNEPKMTALYRTLGLGAKKLKTCVVLLSQLSSSYQGGIPKPHHVRYTRLAEALVVLNIMLYVPFTDWFEPKDTDILPVSPDAGGYVIKWLSRYRTRTNSGIPHAILVDFDSAMGWNTKQKGQKFLLSNK